MLSKDLMLSLHYNDNRNKSTLIKRDDLRHKKVTLGFTSIEMILEVEIWVGDVHCTIHKEDGNMGLISDGSSEHVAQVYNRYFF